MGQGCESKPGSSPFLPNFMSVGPACPTTVLPFRSVPIAPTMNWLAGTWLCLLQRPLFRWVPRQCSHHLGAFPSTTPNQNHQRHFHDAGRLAGLECRHRDVKPGARLLDEAPGTTGTAGPGGIAAVRGTVRMENSGQRGVVLKKEKVLDK